MATIMPNIIILGPQGSGKSTQSKLLVTRYGYIHISTGDLIRKRSKKNDVVSQKIKNRMDQGKLISADILFNEIIKPYLIKHKHAKLIFDGIPRNISQLKRFNQLLVELNIPKPYLIYINLDKKTIATRIDNRLSCTKCHAIYKPGQLAHRRLICPKDNTKLVKRSDDIDKNALKNVLNYFIQLPRKYFLISKKLNILSKLMDQNL